jgi:hypothetical protein
MFNVNDDIEILILYRLLLAGKFSGSSFDNDLMASPIVARLVNRLALDVNACELKLGGKKAIEFQSARKLLTPDRDEWKIAIIYAQKNFMKKWQTWDDEKRKEVIGYLIAPYEISSDHLQQFLIGIEPKGSSLAK